MCISPLSACIFPVVFCVHFPIVFCVHFPIVFSVHFPVCHLRAFPCLSSACISPLFSDAFSNCHLRAVSVCLAQSCCPSTVTAQSSPPRCFCAQLSPSGPLVLQIYNARTLFVFIATVPHAVVCYPAMSRAGALIQATNSAKL